ncbi:biotin/lipoyl-binding protein [Roseibium salinum]|nr:biotin/lipoyl-binding protein [Roseibium salinum]
MDGERPVFFGEEPEDEPAQSARSRPTLVGVRTSSAETIPQYVYSQGVALPFRTNDVVADISSRVESIEIQQGDEVEAGETIAHLRPEARTSRLESARRRVEQLETDVEAIRRLVTQGFATESRLRDLESQLSDARATLADVSEQIQDTAVKSPIFGIVSDLYVNEKPVAAGRNGTRPHRQQCALADHAERFPARSGRDRARGPGGDQVCG